VNEVDLAYAAGILDGEGSICLTKNRARRWPSPQVAVASNDRELLEWLRAQFGGSISIKQPRRSTHQISYDWKLTDQNALRFLQLVRPYLRIERKIARANLLLEGYLSVTPRNGRYTADMAKQKQALIEQFNSLP